MKVGRTVLLYLEQYGSELWGGAHADTQSGVWIAENDRLWQRRQQRLVTTTRKDAVGKGVDRDKGKEYERKVRVVKSEVTCRGQGSHRCQSLSHGDSPCATVSWVPGIDCRLFMPSVVNRKTRQKYVAWSVSFKFRILRTPDV